MNACLNKRRTRKRNIKKESLCAAAAARMMNDFDFERSRRQSLSLAGLAVRAGPIVPSFFFSLSLFDAGERGERVQENTS